MAWLRAAAGEPRFLGLATIARVEAEVETGGRTTLARRYYLSSAALDAQTFARAVRNHWGIENRLHRVLDVVFHDDLARLRTGHGPENMAVVKHMALNLPNAAATDSLKTRRKRAAWDDTYLSTSSPNPPDLLQAILLARIRAALTIAPEPLFHADPHPIPLRAIPACSATPAACAGKARA